MRDFALSFVGAPPVLLAPMAGATDPPFRRAAQAAGAGYTVSEIVASEALAGARRDMVRRVAGAGSLSPLVVQLAGRDPAWMGKGAQLACEAGADVIDINMGCPAKTVTGGAAGSALMRVPDRAAALIEAVVAASSVPVTVKMRLGWCPASLNAADLARRAEDAGVAMITVHGRTRSQFFKGEANWAAIGEVSAAVSIPVIANGDIGCASSAKAALAQSGASGVMIGRASLGKPWLVGQVQQALEGRAVAPTSPEAQAQSLIALYRDMLDFYGERLGVRLARKHFAAAIDDAAWFPVAERRALRGHVCTLEDPLAVEGALLAAFQPRAWAEAA